jgi:hypothetical protein
MQIFSDARLLADHLLATRQDKKEFFIGIDGKDGVGKTKLAREISELIGAKVISLDDYIEGQQNNYVPSLKTNELTKAIEGVAGFIVLEGVCLLAAVEQLGISIDEHVYMKRIRHGLWVDEDVCCLEGAVDDVITREEKSLFVFMEWEASTCGNEPPTEKDVKLSGLTEEIIRYHAKYLPSQVADILYEASHV